MRAKTILALLFLCAIAVTVVLFYRVMPKQAEAVANAPAAPAAPQEEILVAATDLPAGTFLRAQDLAWASRHGAQQASEILRPRTNTFLFKPETDEQARSGVYGAALRQALKQGDAITIDGVAKPNDRDFLRTVLTQGTRAITLPISGTGTGLMYPGDHVDVILTQTFKAGPDREDDPTRRSVSETVAENLRVVAIDPGTAPNRPVTLEVTPQQAQQINVAMELGKLSMTLRSANDPGSEANASHQTWAGDVSPALLTTKPAIKAAVQAAVPPPPPPAAPPPEPPGIKIMRANQLEEVKRR